MDAKRRSKRLNSVRDLDVYNIAFETAMTIFKISKTFPQDEKYALTDQVRRSSRSVCANLAEGWRKRKYKAVFVNKLLDAAQEAAETQWRRKFFANNLKTSLVLAKPKEWASDRPSSELVSGRSSLCNSPSHGEYVVL